MILRSLDKLCGKRLKELGSKYKITKVIHSTMLRASETAQIIHKEMGDTNVPIKTDILLCEGNKTQNPTNYILTYI